MVGLAIISVISLIGWTPMIKQNKLDSGKIQRAEQSGLNTNRFGNQHGMDDCILLWSAVTNLLFINYLVTHNLRRKEL